MENVDTALAEFQHKRTCRFRPAAKVRSQFAGKRSDGMTAASVARIVTMYGVSAQARVTRIFWELVFRGRDD
jgi:hypothetical protein